MGVEAEGDELPSPLGCSSERYKGSSKRYSGSPVCVGVESCCPRCAAGSISHP